MLAGDSAPRFSVNLALKDLRLAVDVAARWHASVPLGAAGLQAFSAAAARGLGEEDVANCLQTLWVVNVPGSLAWTQGKP